MAERVFRVQYFHDGDPKEREVRGLELSHGLYGRLLADLRARLGAKALPDSARLEDDDGRPLSAVLDGSEAARAALAALPGALVFLDPPRAGASGSAAPAGAGFSRREEVDIPPDTSLSSTLAEDCDIRAAFGELIDNAIQMTSGQKGRRIVVTIDPDNRVLTVRDNGRGMSYADAKEIGRLGFSINGRQRQPRGFPQQPDEADAAFVTQHLMTSDLSRYGLGMKRAAFFVGDRVRIDSHMAGCSFVTSVEFRKNEYKASVLRRDATAEERKGAFFSIRITCEAEGEGEEQGPFWTRYRSMGAEAIMQHIGEKYMWYMAGGFEEMLEKVEIEFQEEGRPITNLTSTFLEAVAMHNGLLPWALPKWVKGISAWRLYAGFARDLGKVFKLPLLDLSGRVYGVLWVQYFPRRDGRETLPSWAKAAEGGAEGAASESRVYVAWNGLHLPDSPVNHLTSDFRHVLNFMVPPPRTAKGAIAARKRQEHVPVKIGRESIDIPLRCFESRAMGVLFLHADIKIDTQKTFVDPAHALVRSIMLEPVPVKGKVNELWEKYAQWIDRSHREQDQDITWEMRPSEYDHDAGVYRPRQVEYMNVKYQTGEMVKYAEEDNEPEAAAAGRGSDAAAAGRDSEAADGNSGSPRGPEPIVEPPSASTSAKKKGKTLAAKSGGKGNKPKGKGQVEPAGTPGVKKGGKVKLRVGRIHRFEMSDDASGRVEIEPVGDEKWPELEPALDRIKIEQLRDRPTKKEIEDAAKEARERSPVSVQFATAATGVPASYVLEELAALDIGRERTIACHLADASKGVVELRGLLRTEGVVVAVYVPSSTSTESRTAAAVPDELDKESQSKLRQKPRHKLVVATMAAGPGVAYQERFYRPTITLHLDSEHVVAVHAVRLKKNADGTAGAEWELDKRLEPCTRKVTIKPGDIDGFKLSWQLPSREKGQPTIPFGVVAPAIVLKPVDHCNNEIRGNWRADAGSIKVTARLTQASNDPNYANRKHLEVHLPDSGLTVEASGGQLVAHGLHFEPKADQQSSRQLKSGQIDFLAATLQVVVSLETGEGESARPKEFVHTLQCSVTAGPPVALELDRGRASGAGEPAAIELQDGAKFPAGKLSVVPLDAFGYRSTRACAGYRLEYDLDEAGGLLEAVAGVEMSSPLAQQGQQSQRPVQPSPPLNVRGHPGETGSLVLRIVGELPEALRHRGLHEETEPQPLRVPFKIAFLRLRAVYRPGNSAAQSGIAVVPTDADGLLSLEVDESRETTVLIEAQRENGSVDSRYASNETKLAWKREGPDDADQTEEEDSVPLSNGKAKLQSLALPDAFRPLRAPELLLYRFSVDGSASLHTTFEIRWMPAIPARLELQLAGEDDQLHVASGELCEIKMRVLDAQDQPIRQRSARLAIRAERDIQVEMAVDELTVTTDDDGILHVPPLRLTGSARAGGEVIVEAFVRTFGRGGEPHEAALPKIEIPATILPGKPETLVAQNPGSNADGEVKVKFRKPLRIKLVLRDSNGADSDYAGNALVRVLDGELEGRPFPPGAGEVGVAFNDGEALFEGPVVPRTPECTVREVRAKAHVKLPAEELELETAFRVLVTGDPEVFFKAISLYSVVQEGITEFKDATKVIAVSATAGKAIGDQVSFRLVSEVHQEWSLPGDVPLSFGLCRQLRFDGAGRVVQHGDVEGVVDFPPGTSHNRHVGTQLQQLVLFQTPQEYPVPMRAGKFTVCVFPRIDGTDWHDCFLTQTVVNVTAGRPFAVSIGAAGFASDALAPMPPQPAAVPVLRPGSVLSPIDVALVDEFDNLCEGQGSGGGRVAVELRIVLPPEGDRPEHRLPLSGLTEQPVVNGRARFEGIAVAGEGPTSGDYRLQFLLRGIDIEGDTPLPGHKSLPRIAFQSAEASAEVQRAVDEVHRAKGRQDEAQAKLNQARDRLNDETRKLTAKRSEIARVRGLQGFFDAHANPNFPFAIHIANETTALQQAQSEPLRDWRLYQPNEHPTTRRSIDNLLHDSQAGGPVRGFMGFLAQLGRVERNDFAEAIARHLDRKMQWAVFENQDAVNAVKRQPGYERLQMLPLGSMARSPSCLFEGDVDRGDPQRPLRLPPIPAAGAYRAHYMVNLIALRPDQVARNLRGTLWWYALRDAVLFEREDDLPRYLRDVMGGRLDRTLVAMRRDAAGRFVGIEVQQSGPQLSGPDVGSHAAPAAFASVPLEERPSVAEAQRRLEALRSMHRLRGEEAQLAASLQARQREQAAAHAAVEELTRQYNERRAQLAALQARERVGGDEEEEAGGADRRGKGAAKRAAAAPAAGGAKRSRPGEGQGQGEGGAGPSRARGSR